jgi:hypothetical protein
MVRSLIAVSASKTAISNLQDATMWLLSVMAMDLTMYLTVVMIRKLKLFKSMIRICAL